MLMRMKWLLVFTPTIVALSVAVSGCGGSSAQPTPVPTRPAVQQVVLRVDRHAVATARTFLRAFKRSDRQTMLRLMSPRLLRLDQHEYISQMLGVQSAPLSIAIDQARTYRSHKGRWTRVVAGLQFDHGTVTDQLAVIRGAGGYKIDSIRYLRASG